MTRVFKALAAVQLTLSLIYCFLSYMKYSDENSWLQKYYDRAHLFTYGFTGVASGIFGVISVNSGQRFNIRLDLN